MMKLVKEQDGTYGFVFKGEMIIHPSLDHYGEPCSPAVYGFEIYNTGGGCTAWKKSFELSDNTPVHMLLTQDMSHELDLNQPIEIGVYDESDEGTDTWIFWTIDQDFNVTPPLSCNWSK